MDSLKVEHLVYAPVPYKGYSVRARSKGASVELFSNALRDWFIPFDQGIISPGFFERLAVFEGGKLYLNRIFTAEKLDELMRGGVVSHIAEIPVSLVKENKVSLKLIDKVMSEQVNELKVPVGHVEPLEVPLVQGADTELELTRGILPTDVASAIAKGVFDERMRVFVLYKGLDKFDLIIALIKLLSEPSAKGLLVASENLKSDVLYLYDSAVIVGRMMPPWARIRGWKIVNLGKHREVAGAGSTIVEEILKRIYGGT